MSSVEPDGDTNDDNNGFFVTLSAKLGPFSRSKKLRMIKTYTSEEPPSTEASGSRSQIESGMTTSESPEGPASRVVRFERHETQPGEFSNWIMEATVEPTDTTTESEVTVELIYDGDLWTGGLEGLLDSQIEKSVEKLSDYVNQ